MLRAGSEIQRLRELARSRTFLVRARTKLMNRIHAKLRSPIRAGSPEAQQPLMPIIE